MSPQRGPGYGIITSSSSTLVLTPSGLESSIHRQWTLEHMEQFRVAMTESPVSAELIIDHTHIGHVVAMSSGFSLRGPGPFMRYQCCCAVIQSHVDMRDFFQRMCAHGIAQSVLWSDTHEEDEDERWAKTTNLTHSFLGRVARNQ